MNDSSENSLKGKRVVVTGGGSGIGRATAELMARTGAEVTILGRTPDELADVLNAMGGEAAGHHQVVADISSESEMIAAYHEIGSWWDHIDTVVANAGINGVWAPLELLKVEEWDQTLAINLRGTFLTVKLALPLLKKKGGSVVIVSSINGNRIFSNSGATAYACSKAGQVAFSRMVALELAKDHIRVNAVCPGAIDTQIDDSTERRSVSKLHLPVKFPQGDVPLNEGKPGMAEDVARAIWFLACDLSSHISGTEIYVDGAQSLLQG